jgi:hypothetical protein
MPVVIRASRLAFLGREDAAAIQADGFEVMFEACPDVASLPNAPKGVCLAQKSRSIT